MAKQMDPEEAQRATEKKKIKEERKKLKDEQKKQRKEAKKKVKELSAQEAELTEDEEAGGMPVFFVTLFIIAIWIAILCVLVKLDVGGIGSGVLSPLLKNVPVVNKILPKEQLPVESDTEIYSGYTNMDEAIEQIRRLEMELEQAQEKNLSHDEVVAELKAEISRLQSFEDSQVEFERIRTEFYEEVVYAENGPGPEDYQKYYEAMDPATAEYIYKQVVQENTVSKEITDYAAAYSSMKPKEAAAIFDTMTDDFELVAKILSAMSAEDRGKIMAQMREENAARITKIMEPGQ